jgi:hypothetical protein
MRNGLGGLILRSTVPGDTQQQRYIPGVRALLLLALLVLPAIGLHAEDHAAIVFTQSAAEVAVFDFVETACGVQQVVDNDDVEAL